MYLKGRASDGERQKERETLTIHWLLFKWDKLKPGGSSGSPKWVQGLLSQAAYQGAGSQVQQLGL